MTTVGARASHIDHRASQLPPITDLRLPLLVLPLIILPIAVLLLVLEVLGLGLLLLCLLQLLLRIHGGWLARCLAGSVRVCWGSVLLLTRAGVPLSLPACLPGLLGRCCCRWVGGSGEARQADERV